MLTTLFAAALIGIDAMKVTVEINVAAGLPSFTVVGLPDSAIRESRERILTAIRNSGFRPKPKKITINLAPADIRKEGTAFDLPIAMGLLGSHELLDADFAGTLIMGELALDGTVRRINGALPVGVMAGKEGIQRLILPRQNAEEAAVAVAAAGSALPVYGVDTLLDTIEIINGSPEHRPVEVNLDSLFEGIARSAVDFADIKGQASAKKSP